MSKKRKQSGHILSKKERLQISEPYKPHRVEKKEEKIEKGFTVCPRCFSVLFEKKWTQGFPLVAEHFEDQETYFSFCPSCREIKDHTPEGITPRGIIEITGELSFDLWGMIKNVVQKEESRDPEKRILKVEKKGRKTVLFISDDNLAQTIGKKLQNTYKKSDLVLEYLHRDGELVRIFWEKRMKNG